MRLSSLLPLLALALPAGAQVTVDGSIAGDAYGAALAVQTVETGFGDDLSELDAAYATISGGRLHLALTGNLQNNFNRLEIFIDSVPGGENVFSGVPGNDGTASMTGLTFDPGFAADVHVIARRGVNGSNPTFDLDVARLGTALASQHLEVLGGPSVGAGATGTGPANLYPILVAYDGSNTGGIAGGTGPANQAAALAVTTGLELGIDLSDLGSPAGEVKVLVFINNADHNFPSNQFLGGLPAPQVNMGGDGAGTFTGTVTFDLGNWAGEQFFTVPAPANGPGSSYCDSGPNSTGGAARISATGSASLAANSLTLAAGPVPAELGLFFTGPLPANAPFGNGTRCVGGSLARLNPAALPVAGTATRAVDLQGAGFQPGLAHFQYVFRDSAAGGARFDLSDGYAVVLVP